MIEQAVESLLQGDRLHSGLAHSALEEILQGRAPAPLVRQFFALTHRLPSIEEHWGAVKALTCCAHRPQVQADLSLETGCPVPPDHRHLDVLPAAAAVVASAGVRVAKLSFPPEWNRPDSSATLARLGVRPDADPALSLRCLDEAGLGFFWAPRIHPELDSLVRSGHSRGVAALWETALPLVASCPSLSSVVFTPFETLFSHLILVGDEYSRSLVVSHPPFSMPFVSPLFPCLVGESGSAHPLHHVPIDSELAQLEKKKDELISRSAFEEAAELRDRILDLKETHKIDQVFSKTLRPDEMGVPLGGFDSFELKTQPGQEDRDAHLIDQALQNRIGVVRGAILLNSALGLYAAGRAPALRQAVKLAEFQISSGAAHRTFRRVAELSNS